MRGHGREEGRPDKSRVLVTVNQLPDERSQFVLVLELESGAVVGVGAEMVATVATNTRLPVIVSDYESLPPNDKGDRVAVHTSILYRSRRLIGNLLAWLAPEVALYELVKGG